jgi:hypothetical protein
MRLDSRRPTFPSPSYHNVTPAPSRPLKQHNLACNSPVLANGVPRLRQAVPGVPGSQAPSGQLSLRTAAISIGSRSREKWSNESGYSKTSRFCVRRGSKGIFETCEGKRWWWEAGLTKFTGLRLRQIK